MKMLPLRPRPGWQSPSRDQREPPIYLNFLEGGSGGIGANLSAPRQKYGHVRNPKPWQPRRQFRTKPSAPSFRRKSESSPGWAGAVERAPILPGLTALDPGLRRGDVPCIPGRLPLPNVVTGIYVSAYGAPGRDFLPKVPPRRILIDLYRFRGRRYLPFFF